LSLRELGFLWYHAQQRVYSKLVLSIGLSVFRKQVSVN
jgi:hypothetical protein